MAFNIIVEDGTQVPGSNSYVDVADATAFITMDPRQGAAWSGVLDQGAMLAFATKWLDDHVIWVGDRTSDPCYPSYPWDVPPPNPQSLGWPRRNARDRENRIIAHNVVPVEIQRATALMANYFANGSDIADEEQAGLRRFRADTFEIEYQMGYYKSPAPSWLKFTLFGLGQLGNEIGFKKIKRV